jgi:pimeloyl-ACP methyl ester carboxylesterase
MDGDDLELTVAAPDGVELSGDSSGEGPTAVLLLHGLTATRRYVVMGSRTLQRSRHSVIAYDARGHGKSSPALDRAYGYESLSADALAVLDAVGVDCAILAGASMGAHTAIRVALDHPERVSGLVLITPAYLPGCDRSASELARWDALAAGLRDGGVHGFIAAYELDHVPARWRDTYRTVLTQRLSAHRHPGAVADALEVVPRSRPFEAIEQLAGLRQPTLLVASRDEADPGHPQAVAETYARTIPGAELVIEEEGSSPIAWQGGRVSRAIADLAARATAARGQTDRS